MLQKDTRQDKKKNMSRPASEVEATDESDSSHDTNSRAKYKLERSKQGKLEETMRKSQNNGDGKERCGGKSLSRVGLGLVGRMSNETTRHRKEAPRVRTQ